MIYKSEIFELIDDCFVSTILNDVKDFICCRIFRKFFKVGKAKAVYFELYERPGKDRIGFCVEITDNKYYILTNGKENYDPIIDKVFKPYINKKIYIKCKVVK